jgi:hypothetical protein
MTPIHLHWGHLVFKVFVNEQLRFLSAFVTDRNSRSLKPCRNAYGESFASMREPWMVLIRLIFGALNIEAFFK